ncbi:hypothetical protein ACJX0J_042340, partial [Zea mays]
SFRSYLAYQYQRIRILLAQFENHVCAVIRTSLCLAQSLGLLCSYHNDGLLVTGHDTFNLYINMKTQKISKLLSKRFTTPIWIKVLLLKFAFPFSLYVQLKQHKEPREVNMFVDLLLLEVLESTFRNMSSFRLSSRRAWERQVRPRGLLRLRTLAPRAAPAHAGPQRCTLADFGYLKDLPELLHRIVHGGVSTRTPGKKARLTTKCSRGRGRVCFGNRTRRSRAELATRASAQRRSASRLAYSTTGDSRPRPWWRAGLGEKRPLRGRSRCTEIICLSYVYAICLLKADKIFFLIGLCCETSGAGGTATDKSNKNKQKASLKRSKGSLGSLDVVAVKNNKSPAKPSTSSSNEGSSQSTTEILQNVIARSRDTTLSEPAKVGEKPSTSFQV